MSSFTLTGRLMQHDAVTPIVGAAVKIVPVIDSMPDPAANDVYLGELILETDVEGEFSSTLVTLSGLYYTVRSADSQTNLTPTTFVAPVAGSTIDLADIVTVVPAPILPADAAALRAEFIAADSVLRAEFVGSGSAFLNPKDRGAVGDGVADDTTEIADTGADALTTGQIMRIPKGSYLQSGTVYPVAGDWLWSNHGYTTAVNKADSARKNNILVTTQTADTSPQDPAESRVAISVTVAANGSHHGTGVRSNLRNSSDDGNGCTAFYGSAVSDTDANWSAAVHGETRHAGGTSIGISSESASYVATGTLYGVVVNNTTSGADPTHPITGAGPVAATTALGVAFRAASVTTAWVTGIDVSATAIRTSGNVFKSAATPNRHFWTTGAAAIADINLEGTSAYGIILGADYTSGNAIRMKTGNAIAFEATGAVAMAHAATPGRIIMSNAGSDRISFDVSATPMVNILGTKVLSVRQTGWAAATGTATRTSFATSTVTLPNLAQAVKALIDDLTTHGLIGA